MTFMMVFYYSSQKFDTGDGIGGKNLYFYSPWFSFLMIHSDDTFL